MAKANVILLNSILWNLREITKLAEKIKKDCGDVDCVSWRYPLTSCRELEVYKLLQNNRSLDSYTYILELTYDRLLYVFNLMIKYLESTDTLEEFRPDRNILRPNTLSLASVLHMIWDRVKAQTKRCDRNFAAQIEVKSSKSSTCTQSEVCSISVCSCCEMAQELITQLVLGLEKILEKQDFASAISEERKVMREYLVEMTNWSAMSRWLTAILKDFTTVSEKAEQATLSSQKLRHRLDSGQRKIKIMLEQYAEEKEKLEKRLQEYEERTNKEIDELVKDNERLREVIEMKKAEITKNLSKFEKEIDELKKTYESKLSKKKERRTRKQIEKEMEWKRKLEFESGKRKDLECQNEKLSAAICKYKEEVERLKGQVEDDKNNFSDRYKNLENEMESLKKDNLRLNEVVGEKQKIIEDYSVRIMEAFPELNAPKSKYKASGNPQVDMENQIESNTLRIEHLKKENEKLSKTLDKMKSMKT